MVIDSSIELQVLQPSLSARLYHAHAVEMHNVIKISALLH